MLCVVDKVCLKWGHFLVFRDFSLGTFQREKRESKFLKTFNELCTAQTFDWSYENCNLSKVAIILLITNSIVTTYQKSIYQITFKLFYEIFLGNVVYVAVKLIFSPRMLTKVTFLCANNWFYRSRTYIYGKVSSLLLHAIDFAFLLLLSLPLFPWSITYDKERSKNK